MPEAVSSGAKGVFATLLTASGRGAIAVVTVWGNGSAAIIDRVFQPSRRRPLSQSKTGELRLGRLGDEAVVARLANPTRFEIHCHGGSAAPELVLQSLREQGVRVVAARRWLRAAARNAIEAGANHTLARAKTIRCAEILLGQANGALAEELMALLHLLSGEMGDLQRAEVRGRLVRLSTHATVGTRLVVGWRVALGGRPNVGKSMLMNALLGYARAIVAPTPGTTRDLVSAAAAFDGWPVELTDTAGIRETNEPIEAAGVALAVRQHAQADLTLLVLDLSKPLIELDYSLLVQYPHALVVANKADLPQAWSPSDHQALSVSALERIGIERLTVEISRRLVPNPPRANDPVPFRTAQARTVVRMLELFDSDEFDAVRRAIVRLVGQPGAAFQGLCAT
jgi:tRNA modification GTPase